MLKFLSEDSRPKRLCAAGFLSASRSSEGLGVPEPVAPPPDIPGVPPPEIPEPGSLMYLATKNQAATFIQFEPIRNPVRDNLSWLNSSLIHSCSTAYATPLSNSSGERSLPSPKKAFFTSSRNPGLIGLYAMSHHNFADRDRAFRWLHRYLVCGALKRARLAISVPCKFHGRFRVSGTV